jgi:heat shock protein HslJ
MVRRAAVAFLLALAGCAQIAPAPAPQGWKSAGTGQIEFGPMAITRAACPPGSLHDQIVRQLPYVRSYVIKEGHLFLSLMADGGIYEFETKPN